MITHLLCPWSQCRIKRGAKGAAALGRAQFLGPAIGGSGKLVIGL